MKKRVLGFALTLLMLVSLIIPTGSAQAAMGVNHELQVSLMAALGIVPGYPDNYEAAAKVSQKDFVTYAYAAVGTVLSDADTIAEGFGFDGESDITYEQAARVILSVTGYSAVAGSDGYSYVQSAGLFSGVSNASKGAYVTTESAAVMLYNVIGMKALEWNNNEYTKSDTTIMEDKLDVYKISGIVNATNETGINGYSSTSKTTVRIGDEVYNTGATTAQAMLGQYVKLYYKNDKAAGEYVIKWIEPDSSKNNTMTVYGCDVTEVTSTSVKFDSDRGVSKTAKIAQNAQVIYNGSINSGKTIEAITSLTCEATLIANDGSSTYNVVIIKDYTYYSVDGFSSSSLIVNDYSSKEALDVDEQNYSVFGIYKNGIPVTTGDIAVGQVLAAAKSDDGKNIWIEILTGSVSGEITSYSSDSVIIDGISYDISPAYVGDRLKNGRSGTFYFDKLGKIVRCSALKSQTSQYGYLMKYFSDTDGQSDYTARILTADGAVNEFRVKDSIKFNDNKKSSYDVYYLIDAGNNCEQLITYAIDSNNVITTINTADSRYIGVDEENIDSFTLNYTGTGRYRKNNMCFNTKYLIDSTTPIFFIPYDGERDEYTVKNASYLTNGYIYNISVYDIDEYMYASAIVMRENLIEPENMRNKRALVVDKIIESVDDDGEIGVAIEGYQQGSRVSYFLYNENMTDNRGNTAIKNLNAGDVIIYGTNAKGEINVVQIMYRAASNRLAIASGTTTPDTYWEGGTAVFPDMWASSGEVINRNSELIMVDDDGDDDKISKSPHLLGTCTTYLYENGKVTVSNKNEISVGDTVYVQEYQGKVYDVLIAR